MPNFFFHLPGTGSWRPIFFGFSYGSHFTLTSHFSPVTLVRIYIQGKSHRSTRNTRFAFSRASKKKHRTKANDRERGRERRALMQLKTQLIPWEENALDASHAYILCIFICPSMFFPMYMWDVCTDIKSHVGITHNVPYLLKKKGTKSRNNSKSWKQFCQN